MLIDDFEGVENETSKKLCTIACIKMTLKLSTLKEKKINSVLAQTVQLVYIKNSNLIL